MARTIQSRRPRRADEKPGGGGVPSRDGGNSLGTRSAAPRPPFLNGRELAIAERVLAGELRISGLDRAFVLSHLELALDSIEPLLAAPRDRWTRDADPWSTLCVAVAVTHRRVHGWPCTGARTWAALREAVARAIATAGRTLDDALREAEVGS